MVKDRRTAMVGVLVVAVFLSLSTFMNPGKALAAYECFMKITDSSGRMPINGESTVKGKENLIEIISWSLGGHFPTDPRSGSPSQKKIMQPFKLTMRTSKASPPLLQVFNTGMRLSVTLTARKPATSGDYLTITLTNALVISFVNLGNSKSTEAYPIEELVLTYQRMQIEYKPTLPDGSLGTPVIVIFDWEITGEK